MGPSSHDFINMYKVVFILNNKLLTVCQMSLLFILFVTLSQEPSAISVLLQTQEQVRIKLVEL